MTESNFAYVILNLERWTGSGSLTWIWKKYLVNEMNDTICSDNVLFEHHFDAIHGQTFTITANFNVVSLHSLIRSSSQDGLRALDRVQEVELQQSWNKRMPFNLVCGSFVYLNLHLTHLHLYFLSCCTATEEVLPTFPCRFLCDEMIWHTMFNFV